ncbi:MAG: DUF5679 domain-containing protein [Nitrosotalea sp.]
MVDETFDQDDALAYCVNCRRRVKIDQAKNVKLKNGRPAVKGLCSRCGTNVFRIGVSVKP